MLFAASQTDFAGARLRSALFLDRNLRLHVVGKERLLFDSRYAPPSPVVRDVVTIYLLLAGSMDTATGSVPGPAAWVLAETELERIVPGAPWFRAWGPTSLTVEMRIPRSAVRGPIGLTCGPRTLSAATWDAAATLTALARSDGAGAAPLAPVEHFLAQLAVDGVLGSGAIPLTAHEDHALTRLWQAVTPAYDAYATAVTIDQVAAHSERSSRQVRRELKELAKRFDLFGGNFRHITRILRLRAALLLLSAPEASVAVVAERVGYGSAVAMARAFRDAELPTPSDLRALVRYPG